MHPRPSPAPPPSLGSAELADAAVPRWRSTTPEEDAPQPGSPSSEHSKPFTPTAAARRAPLTPAVGIDCGSTAASSAASAPTASAAARHNPGGAACTEALWRRARCFMQCVTGSPLAQSALLSLELAGAHPTVPQGLGLAPGQALQWTLAQLLVLHLKSGLPQGASLALATACAAPPAPLVPQATWQARAGGRIACMHRVGATPGRAALLAERARRALPTAWPCSQRGDGAGLAVAARVCGELPTVGSDRVP